MRTREVDNTVRDLNNSDGRDISGITRQIQELQRNPAAWARERDAINDRVNMGRLGFANNDDIQITGVDQQGRLMTRSSDGRQEHVRDGRTGAGNRTARCSERSCHPEWRTRLPRSGWQWCREIYSTSRRHAIAYCTPTTQSRDGCRAIFARYS